MKWVVDESKETPEQAMKRKATYLKCMLVLMAAFILVIFGGVYWFWHIVGVW